MNVRTISRCLLFLIAVIGGGEPNQISSIEGFVTSEVTASLADAKIGLDGLARPIHRETRTDASGYYFLGDVQPGAYTLWADVAGMGCIMYPRVVVNYSEHVRRDFQFIRGKRPGGCEPLEKKKDDR
jgi:hypothetical protein